MTSASEEEVFLRVNEQNVRAEKCYSKVGFRPKGRVQIKDDEDKPSTLLLMTLSL